MKFARTVFIIAGAWGFAILTPLYFTLELIGRSYPPPMPIAHADLYYGFIGVTLVWQAAFLIIATNPGRYRPMMIAAIFEKLVYITTLVTLYLKGFLQAGQVAVAAPDFVLALLFIAAFFKTADRA